MRALDDLLQRWAEEAAERAELDGVIDLDEEPVEVDREAALDELRREPDPEIASPWRQTP